MAKDHTILTETIKSYQVGPNLWRVWYRNDRGTASWEDFPTQAAADARATFVTNNATQNG